MTKKNPKVMTVQIIPQFTITRLLIVSDEGGLPIVDIPIASLNELQIRSVVEEYVKIGIFQFMSGRPVGPKDNTTSLYVLGTFGIDYRDQPEETKAAFDRAAIVLDMVEKQLHEGER